ncbi:MAG: methylmalonyl Co-A mutase-associated GTPase MeaB [Candidatus Methylomirabilales bacterium]
MNLVEQVRSGNFRAMARLMSLIEEGSADATAALRALYPFTGSAYLLGITGPPSSGKSTLVDRLTEAFRRQGLTIGIVAVDPTSPFSGGAILADRIRMQRHSLDAGVFIRSMATRGQLGGLAKATHDVVQVLDAAGKEIILIETVGVGQDEVEVAKTAHTTIVVTVPGLGDDIQAIKAGLLEVADLFVVNKADREGADQTVQELQTMLALGSAPRPWTPPIVKAIATTGTGLDDLVTQIRAHEAYLRQPDHRRERERARCRSLILTLLQEMLAHEALSRVSNSPTWEDQLDAVVERRLDPYQAAENLLHDP